MKDGLGKVFAVMRGAQGSFVAGIIISIYVLIATSAMTITYIIFKKLEELGIFTMIKNAVTEDLAMIKNVAIQCTGKILHIPDLLECLNGTF